MKRMPSKRCLETGKDVAEMTYIGEHNEHSFQTGDAENGDAENARSSGVVSLANPDRRKSAYEIVLTAYGAFMSRRRRLPLLVARYTQALSCRRTGYMKFSAFWDTQPAKI